MAGELDTRFKPQAVLNRIFDSVNNLINVGVESGTISIGGTTYTIKFATIAVSGSGNNTLVSAVTGKKIRVLNYVFMASGTVNAKFQSGASGTDLTGLFYMVANTGASSGVNKYGHFETAAGSLLNFNLSGATAVGGHLSYIEV